MELISVIITVYNSDKYLKKCLESVCNQTYKNLDIVIIDDGSSDQSPLICDEFAMLDSRINVIHKENEGVVRARQDGIITSKGEYVSIIDSDDYLENNMIEELLEAMLENKCDVAMCGRYDETLENSLSVYHGIKAGIYDKDRMIKEVYPHMISNVDFFEWGLFPSLWDKLFKRDVLFKHIMNVNPTLPMGNDAAVVYPCILNANKIVILNSCLYHYRQVATSISKSMKDYTKTRYGFVQLFNSVNELLSNYTNVYDCRNQWLEYVIFLLIAKFECLYKELEDCNYLFPFSDVKRGSKVIIYGMGTYGRQLYHYVKKTNICDLVTGIDREYKSLVEQGYKVDHVDNIAKYDYDYIVIAVTYSRIRKEIINELGNKCDMKKIRFIDEKVFLLKEFTAFFDGECKKSNE